MSELKSSLLRKINNLKLLHTLCKVNYMASWKGQSYRVVKKYNQGLLELWSGER